MASSSADSLFDAAAACKVRRSDPDRYFCSLFAPAKKREALWLLYAFNDELARAREVVSAPPLTLIRLAWWREVVEGVEKRHEIATPLSAALRGGVFARADLARLIDARMIEAEEEIPNFSSFMDYARGTAGQLARIAGKLLGANSQAVEDLGTAYGISGIFRTSLFLARQGRSLLPADGTAKVKIVDEARELLCATPPRELRAAWLPAVYAKRDLGKPYRPRDVKDRVAVLRAAITGRI